MALISRDDIRILAIQCNKRSSVLHKHRSTSKEGWESMDIGGVCESAEAEEDCVDAARTRTLFA